MVSRLALGTMTWGAGTEPDEARTQLRAFRDAGGTLVDTSDRYAGGEAERILGRLVAEADRDEILVAAASGSAAGPSPLARGTSRRRMLSGLDASLRRLGLDHVDLWQVHVWDPETPLEETLSALDAATTSGRARYVGVSNFSGWQTAAAATWQRAGVGRAPIVSTQVEYSLLARGVEREVTDAADALGLGLLAWSPLGRGVLTGKYRGGTPADSRGAVGRWPSFVGDYLTYEAGRVVDAVVTAAAGLGVTALAVALAWVRDAPGVTSAVVGARTPTQLAASLTAETLDLPAEIRAALDDVSAPHVGYPERPPPP